MALENVFIMASFTSPENIGITPLSMLWLLPLTASIAVIYKATKLPEIKFANFVRETLILFGSITVFMSITAVVLYVFSQLFL